MRRRLPLLDWRIVAAALAALGVLAGGTLLAAQVQTDLDAGVRSRLPDEYRPPEDTPPLKLKDFKLPKDMTLEVPPGTEISPDLTKMKLPRDLDVKLPDDLDLSGLDLELPQDFDLELPEGTTFEPPGLKLPNGATIKLPDGREFKLPPGSELDLPPEVLSRLLQQGLPVGTLDAPRTLPMRDLPPDLHATFDPPAFDGSGTLRLPGGTTIELPEGQRLPFPVGALPYAMRYLVPAGSSFDMPFDAHTSRGGTFPVPQPTSPTQLRADARGSVNATAVETEITSMPSRVRKGETMTVGGYVRERATGRPVAGAPVDVFLNETKSAPGVLVGQGVSDASGTFKIDLRLPTDKPAREYQLVNHAVGFVDARGRAFGDAWGDPPFAMVASTTLTLELPARDGAGAPTLIAGTLVDHTGQPVAGASVVVSVDGANTAYPVTDADGRFSFAHWFSVGTHYVEARFPGSDAYDASRLVRGIIEVEDFTLEVPYELEARPGGTLTLTGRASASGAVAPERSVEIRTPLLANDVTALTDAEGEFSHALTVPARLVAGAYPVTYTIDLHGITKTSVVHVLQSGKLELTAPTQADVDQPFAVTATLTDDAGAALAGYDLTLRLAGPGGARDVTATTDSRGRVSVTMAPLRAVQGNYTLSALPPDIAQLDVDPVSQRVSLGRFEVVWDVPATAVRGATLTGSATVRLAGAPYANAPVALVAFEPMQVTTSPEGAVAWSVTVPTTASVGEHAITLGSAAHGERSTTISILAVPSLTLETPDSFEVGKPVRASVTLVDDQGDPIRDSTVLLNVSRPEGAETIAVRTDARGRWSGELNTTQYLANISLSATYRPAGASSSALAAQDVQTMSATAPTPRAPSSPLTWLLPLVGLVAAGAGGGAYYYLRRRPRASEAAPAAAAAAAPALRPAEIELRFAIPDGEPAVWGVGEPLRLAARNLGEAGEVELAWRGGSSRVHLAAGAEASTELAFPEEGEVEVRAQRLAPDVAPAVASVRIVDYRKETAREFDLFLDKARALDAALTTRSTPREISWTLAGRLGPDAEAHLDEIALVLEITNYSQYDVSREHYLRFLRAARALDPLFGS